MIDRRAFLAGSAALAACQGYVQESRRARADFRSLLGALGPGARLGVAALDTGSGRWLLHDENSRYAMASTFKLPLAAAMYQGAMQRRWTVSDEIGFGEADLLDYAPRVRAAFDAGRRTMTIEALCEAIITVSDNSAANLLLGKLGGPAALTRFCRSCGDNFTRLDRTEPTLNSNLPGDPRDTTTPLAMATLMQQILTRQVAGMPGEDHLIAYMRDATTGPNRLRSGLPRNWLVGDKTGNGANGAANDLAFAVPPGRQPILIASYQSGGTAETPARDAVHAAVARAVAAAFL